MASRERPGFVTRALVRFTTYPDGRLRGGRMLALAALGGLIVAIGTTIAIVAADAGNPATLSIWVLVSFLGVKLPLLGLLWWILGRRDRGTTPSADELDMMLKRLDGAVATAVRSPDAADRLEILRDEAWFVADNAPSPLRQQAAELAARIEEMRRAHAPA